MKSQLFILDSDMVRAMTVQDAYATFMDMTDMGIAKPPYPVFTIQCSMPTLHALMHDSVGKEAADSSVPENVRDYDLRISFANWEWGASRRIENASIKFEIGQRNHWQALDTAEMPESVFEVFLEMAVLVFRLLIVSLATRNVERRTVHNRLAKFGLGKKAGADFDYVTTIKMGKLIEYDGEHGEGQPKRPHLRRGHVRDQRYGPGNQYIKRIFVEPIFVNGYVPSDDHRAAYNVSKAS